MMRTHEGGCRDWSKRMRIGALVILGGAALILALAPAALRHSGVYAAADQPTVTVVAPTDGLVVTDNAVAVVPQFKNWAQRCDLAGTPNVAGTGHYHIEIDGSLVNMFCGPAVVSLENVKPGTHTLTILPAKNDHEEIEAAKVQVKIDYQPSAALPAVGGLNVGKPTVTVLYPKNGATVSGKTFPLMFDVRNYRLSCDLLGKPKLANTGHWHVNVDTMKGPMMGMVTMLNMGCNNTLDVPLAGISKGKHTFFVLLVENQHAPLEPGVFGSVTLNVQ